MVTVLRCFRMAGGFVTNCHKSLQQSAKQPCIVSMCSLIVALRIHTCSGEYVREVVRSQMVLTACCWGENLLVGETLLANTSFCQHDAQAHAVCLGVNPIVL